MFGEGTIAKVFMFDSGGNHAIYDPETHEASDVQFNGYRLTNQPDSDDFEELQAENMRLFKKLLKQKRKAKRLRNENEYLEMQVALLYDCVNSVKCFSTEKHIIELVNQNISTFNCNRWEENKDNND